MALETISISNISKRRKYLHCILHQYIDPLMNTE